jgi:hypothetical protein
MGNGWFFLDFGFKFFHARGMESTPIYKGWKKDILFLLGQILALDLNRKDLNHWFKVTIMNCQIWQSKAV